MAGVTPSDYLDPLNWGSTTGGAAGTAETTLTLGALRTDSQIPQSTYQIGGLQIARLQQFATLVSTYFKGGTRLQVLPQSANPFGATESGYYIDNSGNAKFSYNGAVTTIGGSSGTVTQVNTGTGLTGGPITTTGTISLANTAVTAGSYTNTNITVDAQGRITAASNGTGGGVTTVSNSDGTLTISPTSGAVVASIALAHANTWTGQQTFNTSAVIFGAGATATGSSAFNLSGSSGTFTSSTGANTLSGLTTIQPGAQSGNVSPVLQALSPAMTTMTASTEMTDFLFDPTSTHQFSTGALTTNRTALFKAPTLSFVAASTVTTAATLTVDRAPQQGTNATITNALAFWTQAGKTWHEIDAVGTSTALSNTALQIINGTAAALNAQQFSPLHGLGHGNGWGTTGGASQSVAWYAQVQPIQGTNPTGELHIMESVNGAAPTDYFKFTDGTALASLPNATFTFNSNVTMNGSAKAFRFTPINNATNGDTALQIDIPGVTGSPAMTYGLNASGATVLQSTGGGNSYIGVTGVNNATSVGIAIDIHGTTNGRNWTLVSLNNATLGNGSFVMQVQNAAGIGGTNILSLTGTSSGNRISGDGGSLTTAAYLPSSTGWGVLKSNTTTNNSVGISAYTDTAALVGVKTQYGTIIESAGTQWDNAGAASNDVAVSLVAHGVDVSAAVPQVDMSFGTYVGTSHTHTPTERMLLSSRTAAGLKISRLTMAKGTSTVAGDYVLSAGWGTTASVGSIIGSDGASDITVTSSGTGQGANPTITFTFHDGGWQNSAGTTAVPVCMVEMRATTDTTITNKITWSTTATALTITYNGTPVATKTYSFSIIVVGTN